LDSIKDIIDELTANKSEITILDLSMNTYVPEVFEKIAELIKGMENLKHIKLESVFDTLTFEEMSEVLKTLSLSLRRDLCSFELPSNAVSCNFPEEFGKFLEESELQELNLHNCGLGEDGLLKIAKHLKNIKKKENLIKLNLSKNRINVICPEFMEVFNEFVNIREFMLEANTIEEKSMSDFLEGIKNRKIEVLNLADNFVCGHGIEGLGAVFLNNNIKELYLQDIKVDKGDIKRLLTLFNKKGGEFPGELDYLKDSLTLDISCNYFEQDCIEELENLAMLVKFKKLIIFENRYEDIEKLKKLIQIEGGVVIDEEEEEIEEVDEELIEKLKVL
jgi:Ran GTPase-activating protein (RanGAP) involved in mRNA processing and transport